MEKITQRQLMALSFVCLCSPVIRILPAAAVRQAGSGAWASVIAAAAPSFIYVYMLCRFMGKRRSGEGMAELIMRCTGSKWGAALCAMYGLWFVIYGGFTLRMSSERLISTIFPEGSLAVISFVTIATALVPAIGSAKNLVRAGEIMFLIITGVLWFILLTAVGEISLENLLPVTLYDTGGILKGAAGVFDVVTGIFCVSFLAAGAEKKGDETKTGLKWCLYILTAIFGITVCTVGCLSAGLVEDMQSPFFIMVRNISFFGVVERIEALIIAVWIFTDFLFLALLMKISAVLFKNAAQVREDKKFYILLGGIIFIISFFISPSLFDLQRLSSFYVPVINVTFSVAVLALIYYIGRARDKI